VLVADDLGAWLIGLLADAGRKRLTTWALGTAQERALRQAAATAVQLTAGELRPGDPESAAELALVISHVFQQAVPAALPAGTVTLLEALRTAIAGQLAVLDDASLTGTGRSAAQALGVTATQLAESLTGQLLREIVLRGARGGPLFALASQLNQDVTHLQGRRLEDMIGQLTEEVRSALAELSRPRRDPVMFLPGRDPSFAGHRDALRELRDRASAHNPAETVIAIHAIDGMAGVGKTALAVQVAHELLPSYPDGAYMIDLHGHTPGMAPLEPSAALVRLLRQDRAAADDIPADLDGLQAEWRWRMAARQAIVVLDNARDSAQVRPLLPGAAGCLVLVTSRKRLIGLTEAPPLSVNVLGQDEAEDLLGRLVGERRAADQAAVAAVVRDCGQLPLAIRIVAARLRHHPDESVAEVAAQLSDARSRLDVLEAEDTSVAASIALSFEALPARLQQAFALCGLHPGAELTAEAIAALGAAGREEAERWLRELADYHLADTTESPAAAGGRRYRQHDLVRAFGRRLSTEIPAAEAEAALLRLVRAYAERLNELRSVDLDIGVVVPAQVATSMWWSLPAWPDGYLVTEQGNIVACTTAVHGRPALASDLARLLTLLGPPLLNDHSPDARPAYQQLLDLAGTVPDQVTALVGLALADLVSQAYPTALDSFARIQVLAAQAGDLDTELQAWRCLAETERLIGDIDAAAASYRRMQELAEESDDPAAPALQGLAELTAWSGDLPVARRLLQQCIGICEHGDDDTGLTLAVWWSGELALLDDDPAAAAASFRRLQELRPGSAYHVVLSLLGIAAAEAALGRAAAARARAREAYLAAAADAIRHHLYSVGNVHMVVQALIRLPRSDEKVTPARPASRQDLAVRIAELEGRRDPGPAAGKLERIAGDAERAGDLGLAGRAYRALAGVLNPDVYVDEIREAAQKSYRLAGRLHDRAGQLCDLLLIDRTQGGYDISAISAAEAAEIAAELREPLAELYALRRLAFCEWESRLNAIEANVLASAAGTLPEEAGQATGGPDFAELPSEQDAIRHFRQAYQLARRAHSPAEQADIMLRLAGIQDFTGDVSAAAKSYRQAAADGLRAGEDGLRARALQRLARIQLRLGDREQAARLYRKACAAYATTRYRQAAGDTLKELGDLELDLGNTAAARQAWQAALGYYAGDTARAEAVSAVTAALDETSW
jgi:tetratricopeptide (TPR) repeat protein